MTTEFATATAEILVECEAVAFSTDPLFTYASGIQSPVYTDNRKLLGFPKLRTRVVDMLEAITREQFGDRHFGAVAGTATAGIAWASWLAERLELPMMYVRSEAKGHGKGKACEGWAPEGSDVLLVEDLFTTGSSAKKSVENLRAEGFTCNSCVVITTYGKPAVEETLAELNMTAAILTNVDETLRQAKMQHKLNDEQVKIVEAWIAEQRA